MTDNSNAGFHNIPSPNFQIGEEVRVDAGFDMIGCAVVVNCLWYVEHKAWGYEVFPDPRPYNDAGSFRECALTKIFSPASMTFQQLMDQVHHPKDVRISERGSNRG